MLCSYFTCINITNTNQNVTMNYLGHFNYSQRDTIFVTNSTPHNPSLLLYSAQCFFANYVIFKSGINLRITPPHLCHTQMTNREGKCQIRNSKSWGHSAYWKFPMVAWLGKGGKEEGKGERTVAREQVPGCGSWAWTSHHHAIINKDADHY